MHRTPWMRSIRRAMSSSAASSPPASISTGANPRARLRVWESASSTSFSIWLACSAYGKGIPLELFLEDLAEEGDSHQLLRDSVVQLVAEPLLLAVADFENLPLKAFLLGHVAHHHQDFVFGARREAGLIVSALPVLRQAVVEGLHDAGREGAFESISGTSPREAPPAHSGRSHPGKGWGVCRD